MINFAKLGGRTTRSEGGAKQYRNLVVLGFLFLLSLKQNKTKKIKKTNAKAHTHIRGLKLCAVCITCGASFS